MDWQQTSSIMAGVSALMLLLGVLLRFRSGRWLLARLWVVLTVLSIFTNQPMTRQRGDSLNDPAKASRNLLMMGSGFLLISFLIYIFHIQ